MSPRFYCEAEQHRERLIWYKANNKSFFLQISDPHGATTLHYQTQPAELSAFTHGHSAREAPRGRLLHAPGRQVAPGLLQVRWRLHTCQYGCFCSTFTVNKSFTVSIFRVINPSALLMRPAGMCNNRSDSGSMVHFKTFLKKNVTQIMI